MSDTNIDKTEVNFGTTRGKVYKHLTKRKWQFVPPRQYKRACLRQQELDHEAQLETYKRQLEYQRIITRLEFNMAYDESVNMDLEDKDASEPYNMCDSDIEYIDSDDDKCKEEPTKIEHKPLVIDLTTESEEDDEVEDVGYYGRWRPLTQLDDDCASIQK